MFIKLKPILFLFLFVFNTIVAFSIPASNVKRIVTLKDGEVLELTLKGDEDFHYWYAEDGRYFIEKAGSYSLVSKQYVDETWRQNRKVRGAVRDNAAYAKRRGGEDANAFVGKKKGLVILMDYPDVKMNPDNYDGNVNAYYKRYFNEKGFHDSGMSGSVHDYFWEQSYGQFDLTFDVVGPYVSKHQMMYYGQNSENGKNVDIYAEDLIVEACRKADADVNFNDYDWDGDGEVDQVYVIYAGYGESYGASEFTIWPHESHIYQNTLVLDATRISTYACSCELEGVEGFNIAGIGTPCHEFSHCLGINDMYDTKYNGGVGMGSWDLMDYGSYVNKGRTPTGYTSYERMVAGWLTPVELNEMTEVKDMKPLVDSPEAYILYNDANRNEYYLLENRQAKSWDEYVGGHGLLVLHVDYDEGIWNNNNINTTPNHQRLTIVPADGALYNTPYSYAGDPYPGTTGKTMLNNYTNPALTLFSPNADGKMYLSKNIDSITETENGFISFVACRPEPAVPVLNDPEILSDNSFKVSWAPSENAESYVISLSEVPALNKGIEECAIIEEDFSKCYSKSAGFTDISSGFSAYTKDAGWTGNKLYTSPKGLQVGTSTVNGYLYTPIFDAPETGDFTYAISVKLYDDSKPVDAVVRLYSTEKKDFDLSFEKSGMMILNISGQTYGFRMGFIPKSRIYVDRICVYEGIWTLEQIQSISSESKRRVVVNEYPVTDTEYVFTDMNPSSKYLVKVMAKDSFVTSMWSEEKSIVLNPTLSINTSEVTDSVVSSRYFSLDGCELAAPISGQLYINRQILSDGSIRIVKKIANR